MDVVNNHTGCKNSDPLTASFSTMPDAPCTEADSKVNMELSRWVRISIAANDFLLDTHIERSQLLPVLIKLVVVELSELLCGEGSALFWWVGIRISAIHICEMLDVQHNNANRDL